VSALAERQIDVMVEYAREVTHAVLKRLGDPAPAWRVLGVEPSSEPVPAPSAMSTSQHLLITLGLGVNNSAAVGAYFSLGVPIDQAVAATAGQIQDHAIEATHGAALPPCPGHQHPMNASSIDGVASWVCPLGSDYHVEAIFPRLPMKSH